MGKPIFQATSQFMLCGEETLRKHAYQGVQKGKPSKNLLVVNELAPLLNPGKQKRETVKKKKKGGGGTGTGRGTGPQP